MSGLFMKVKPELSSGNRKVCLKDSTGTWREDVTRHSSYFVFVTHFYASGKGYDVYEQVMDVA